jgi:hypothetical protein
MKIFINLDQINIKMRGINSSGWSASIGRESGTPGGKSKIAWGESSIYPTKDVAWQSIGVNAEGLDFDVDEVYFNHSQVNTFEDVQKAVAAL